MIVAYCALFATMGGTQALPGELLAATLFLVVAIAGSRTSLWWVAAGIAGHGVFDWTVHSRLLTILLLLGAIPARGSPAS